MKCQRTKKIFFTVFAMIVMLILSLAYAHVHGQIVTAASNTFELPWWTIDSGGGTSSGGAFVISGSFGQADAGPSSLGMNGEGFQIIGGFWHSGLIPQANGDLKFYLPVILR